MRLSTLIAAAVLAVPGTARAEVSSQGELAVEARAFRPDDESATEDVNAGFAGRLELKGKHLPFRERVRLFARGDYFDHGRDVVVVEEANVTFRSDWLEIGAGAFILNWSATEAFHPADVVNARNFDSDIENAEKLGEPMVYAGVPLVDGVFEVYYMPVRMAPRLPGPSSRLTLGGGFAIGAPLFADPDGTLSEDRFAHQFAARVSQTFGGADVALQAVRHNDRSQLAVAVEFVPGTEPVARPVFQQVTHLGLTWAQAVGEWVVKAEGAWRRFDDVDFGDLAPVGFADGLPDHGQAALGLEYGWEYIDLGHEATVILEGQAVLGVGEQDRERLHPFQRDVLLGYRHTMNDVDSTELVVGAIADLERWPEVMLNASYRQRLSDTWSLRAALRLVHAPGGEDKDPDAGEFPNFVESLHEDHQIQLTLTRHF